MCEKWGQPKGKSKFWGAWSSMPPSVEAPLLTPALEDRLKQRWMRYLLSKQQVALVARIGYP